MNPSLVPVAVVVGVGIWQMVVKIPAVLTVIRLAIVRKNVQILRCAMFAFLLSTLRLGVRLSSTVLTYSLVLRVRAPLPLLLLFRIGHSRLIRLRSVQNLVMTTGNR